MIRASDHTPGVQPHRLNDQCLQGSLIDPVTLMEVDSPDRVTVQTRVEEVLPILDLGAFGESQSHCVLERLTDAEIAVTTPDRDTHWPARLLPLHVLGN